MKRKGQLFLIEVIIALTVLIILVTALFSAINFTTPVSKTNLQTQGENAINVLVDSGDLAAYLNQANYSYYTLHEDFLATNNTEKIQVRDTIESSIPIIANFKLFTYRYNYTSTVDDWQQIDIINIENVIPTTESFVVIEYYMPGINGILAEFKVQLFLWYEVS